MSGGQVSLTHTFQLATLQQQPGAGGELFMEGASFVLIRTPFQLPSAQAHRPLTGQPHPRPLPPLACNLVIVPPMNWGVL